MSEIASEYAQEVASAVKRIVHAVVPLWYDEEKPFPTDECLHSLVMKIAVEWLDIKNGPLQTEVIWLAYSDLLVHYEMRPR